MAETPNDAAGLKQYIEEQKALGKTESTSKSLAKAVIKLKQFNPQQFDLEAGGGNAAILQRGVEDPNAQLPGATPGSATSGIPGAPGTTPTGVPNLQNIYDQATSTPEITQLQSELTAKKDALTKAVANINDNPFYSEATRTGRVAKLEDRAQREIADIQDQLNLKNADAQTKVNIALQQYDINNQAYQTQLQRLNFLISSGALLNVSSADLADLAVSTGLTTDMIKGIQTKMVEDKVNPTVITNTDDSGNVTVSVVDATTGKTISQNSLGTIGKASSMSSADETKPGGQLYNAATQAVISDLESVSGDDGYVAPIDFRNLRAQWIALLGAESAGDFDSAFKSYVNPSHAQEYSVSYSFPSANATINSLLNRN